MVGVALRSTEEAIQKTIAEAEAKTGSVHDDKAARKSIAEKTAAAIPGLAAALAAAQAASSTADTELDGAQSALSVAKAEQKAGEKELSVVAARKEDLEKVTAEFFGAAKESGASKAAIKTIVSFGKSFDFDASLISSCVPALAKAPADRGAFDGMIFSQIEAEFKKAMDTWTAKVAELAPGAAARVKNVTNAQLAYDAAIEKVQAAREAKLQAQKELKEGEKTAASAKARVGSWLRDIKQLFDDLEETKAALGEFRDVPMAVFNELKNRETPPEPVEEPVDEPADETPVAETAVAEPAAESAAPVADTAAAAKPAVEAAALVAENIE